MRSIRRRLMFGLAGLALASLTGCQTMSQAFDQTFNQPPEPSSIRSANPAPECDANPFYVALGPYDYGKVFETVLETVHDFGFEVIESNRYDGRVEAAPRVSPGVFQLFKPGSPNLYDRFLSTCQSYRHRLTVKIQPAEQGGYFVEVIARKELEDVARPIKSSTGAAIFRLDQNVDRQFEVIDPTFLEPNWIYRGRDACLEQEIIRRMRQAI